MFEHEPRLHRPTRSLGARVKAGPPLRTFANIRQQPDRPHCSAAFAAFRPKWDEVDEVDTPHPLIAYAHVALPTLPTSAMADCCVPPQCMVRYGMTPIQAILAATNEAARALRMDGKVGSLAPGAYGDLVAVKGDPLADIRVLEHVDAVVKEGKPVR